jgi:4-amino-4-deoxychorismate lyase
MSPWISNGEVRDGLPFDDRAWQYGDGLFETIAIRNRRPRLLDWHLERLATSCGRLGIAVPGTTAIQADIETAIRHAGIDSGCALAKLVVTAGQGPRGYARDTAQTNHYLAVFPGKRLEPRHYRNGVAVRMCSTRLAQQPQLAGIKSLNRLEQVLARNEWNDLSIFEGLTCDTAGELICGTMSNVFIVADNEIVTPDLSRAGVAGIMRRKVLEIAHKHDIRIAVRAIRRESLDDAREMFLTNSQFGLLPVATLDGRALEVGRQTRALAAMLVDEGIEEMAC